MKYFWNNFASLTKLLTIHRVSRSRVLIIRVKQRVRCKQHVGHWIDQGVGRRQSVDYRPTIGTIDTRTYIILAIVWVVCLVTGLFLSQLPYRPLVPHHNYTTWPGNLSHLVHRDFPRSRSSSGSNTRSWRDTERRCTMHCRCS